MLPKKREISSVFVGFDSLWDQIESMFDPQRQTGTEWLAGAFEKYPPFNLIKGENNDYKLEIAVAGFDKNDIDIEVKNDILTISSKTQGNVSTDPQKSDYDDRFVVRGLAKRSFMKQFRLNNGLEVQSADLKNGILTINLVSNKVENIKKIDIT